MPAGPLPVAFGTMPTVRVTEPSVIVIEPVAIVVPNVVLATVAPGAGVVEAPIAVTTRTGTLACARRLASVPPGPAYDDCVNVIV